MIEWIKNHTQTFLGKIIASIVAIVVLLPIVIFIFMKLWFVILPLFALTALGAIAATVWGWIEDEISYSKRYK
jgi:uncharacterized membrane protein